MSKRSLLALLVFLVAGCAVPHPRGDGVDRREGGDEAAEARYRQTLDRDPDDADAHFMLAGVLAAGGRGVEAIEHYERAQALQARYKPKVAEQRRSFLKIYNDDAKRLIAEERYPEAGRILDAAEAMVPGDSATMFLRGRVCEGQADWAGAVESYRRAVSKSPGDRERKLALADALTALAEARFDAGEFQEAWDLLQEARRADSSADLSYVEGTVAYALARTAPEGERERHLNAAAEAFAGYLRRHPDDVDARFNLGAVLLAAGRYGEAVSAYRDLLADEPRDGDLYMVLSRAHSHAGEPRLAAVEEAIGRALDDGEPVRDPAEWAYRAAARFPQSELADACREHLAPDAIHTYVAPGSGLVEVWFYWRRGFIDAFRDGERVGPTFVLPPP